MKIKYLSGKVLLFVFVFCFFFMCPITTLRKTCTFMTYLNYSPTNHTYLLRWPFTPTHVQYTFNKLTEKSPKQQPTKHTFSHHQLPSERVFLHHQLPTKYINTFHHSFLHKDAIFLSFKLYIQSLWLTSTFW